MNRYYWIASTMSLAALAASPALARVDGGDSAACAMEQPCINSVGYEKGNLTFAWTGDYDKYHIRWAREGNGERSRELGGRTTTFTIPDAQPGVRYIFKVSGCYSPIIGKDRCSDWEQQSYTPKPSGPSPSRQRASAPAPAGVLAWSQSANGGIPQKAIRLGQDSDGEPLFGCAALVGPAGQQTMQPGKLSRKLGACSVAYGGREYFVRDYRVFVSSLDYRAFALASVNGGALPARSVRGGTDTNGQPLYFCVVRLGDGSDQVGKIRAGWKACNYSYGGREQSYAGYKVLVLR